MDNALFFVLLDKHRKDCLLNKPGIDVEIDLDRENLYKFMLEAQVLGITLNELLSLKLLGAIYV